MTGTTQFSNFHIKGTKKLTSFHVSITILLSKAYKKGKDMSTTLSTKGQVTIPKTIRDVLKIRSGDRVDFVLENGEIKLRAVEKEKAKSLAGSLNKYSKSGFSDNDVREITKKKVAIDTTKEDSPD